MTYDQFILCKQCNYPSTKLGMSWRKTTWPHNEKCSLRQEFVKIHWRQGCILVILNHYILKPMSNLKKYSMKVFF